MAGPQSIRKSTSDALIPHVRYLFKIKRRMLAACQREGLFPGFYRSALDGVGTIRNKISASHGKAHSAHPPAGREEAEHMIHITCADIVLLVGLAKL